MGVNELCEAWCGSTPKAKKYARQISLAPHGSTQDCGQMCANIQHDPKGMVVDGACCQGDPSCPRVGRLCRGRAWWPYTCACMPCILSYNSCMIFCLPCMGVYMNRAFDLVGCAVCKCMGCYEFTDHTFEGSKAVGSMKDPPKVHWLRARTISRGNIHPTMVKPMVLFEGKIEPADVCQGQVGNCWLIAAIACLSNYPGAIMRVFLTREATERGLYQIRLYDGKEDEFEVVTIDDRIPCTLGTSEPVFARPNGNELWVILLEKAFAKFCGSYALLDSGQTAWAWQAMTGDPVHSLMRNPAGTAWKRLDLVYPEKQEHKRHVQFKVTDEVHSNEQLFWVMRMYIKRRAVLGASIVSAKGELRMDKVGLVQGHAYSVLRVKKVGDLQFVQLRNPWGRFEWKGKWGDQDPLWQRHPEVKAKLRFEKTDDGLFWMEFSHFLTYFSRLDVCNRTTDRDLHLDVNEQDGCCGAAVGCVGGCCGYWCGCEGCSVTLCGHRSEEHQSADSIRSLSPAPSSLKTPLLTPAAGGKKYS